MYWWSTRWSVILYIWPEELGISFLQYPTNQRKKALKRNSFSPDSSSYFEYVLPHQYFLLVFRTQIFCSVPNIRMSFLSLERKNLEHWSQNFKNPSCSFCHCPNIQEYPGVFLHFSTHRTKSIHHLRSSPTFKSLLEHYNHSKKKFPPTILHRVGCLFYQKKKQKPCGLSFLPKTTTETVWVVFTAKRSPVVRDSKHQWYPTAIHRYP